MVEVLALNLKNHFYSNVKLLKSSQRRSCPLVFREFFHPWAMRY